MPQRPEESDATPTPRPEYAQPEQARDIRGWLRSRERWILAAAVALQVFVLAEMVRGKATNFLRGESVLLRVIPVDPRDLFRGEYVILGYEIGRIPPAGITDPTAPGGKAAPSTAQGREVFVTLLPEADGRHYSGGEVGFARPGPGVRFIRGTVTNGSRITFGIESYYVQEGRGREYEQAIRDHRLSADVALTSDGDPALRRLEIE